MPGFFLRSLLLTYNSTVEACLEMQFTRKHLLGLEELSSEEIRMILDTAVPFKEISERQIKKVPVLRGKTIVNLFFEASTRTRTSFEFAEKRLSADTVNVNVSTSSVSKGETLVDMARNLEAMKIDMVVIRHSASGAPAFLSERIDSNVINAGDGWHEHPTQGLLDMLTMRDHLGKLEGLKVVIVGDVIHSRVARSNIWGLKKMGAQVGVCGPPTLVPSSLKELGVTIYPRIEDAMAEADVLNVLRIQPGTHAVQPVPVAGRVQPSLRDQQPPPGGGGAGIVLILHPGADEPGSGDRFRRGRRRAPGDSQAGHQRRGGKNGRAVPAGRRQAGRRAAEATRMHAENKTRQLKEGR